MSSYRTTLELAAGDANDTRVRVNRDTDNGTVRLDVDEEAGTDRAEVYLDREQAIRIGRALIDAAGRVDVLGTPGQLNRHDNALRAIRDTAGIAFAEGATLEAVLERVVLAYRNLALGGPVERGIVAVTATAIRNSYDEEPAR